MSEFWRRNFEPVAPGPYVLHPWHWRAIIGDMRLMVHRPGCIGGPINLSMTQWQYAVCVPDSSGRKDLLIVADAGYASSERDAKVKALQFAVHLFSQHRIKLRKALGLAKVPPIMVEMAGVDVREAADMLRETVRMPREDVVSVPEGVPVADVEIIDPGASSLVSKQDVEAPGALDGGRGEALDGAELPAGDHAEPVPVIVEPGPGLEHVPVPVTVPAEHQVIEVP